ncbi:hypothetical protein HPG69_004522 [Diceros bicornis minor]|uniref:Uncharacterized protein n=1 Tax=Diceros bicornis minor TaxID=77932 RepID=A0A7J7F9G5_DICBM|nr:hypothetical protein HPG69_004522 [Diceros bicornis minor]
MGLRGSMGLGTISSIEAAICTKWEQALKPEVLELCNKSGSHAVPPGSEICGSGELSLRGTEPPARAPAGPHRAV